MLHFGIGLLISAGATALSLQVSSPQARVVPGEPIKLVLRWQSEHPIRVFFVDEDRNLPFLEVVVRRQSSTAVGTYREDLPEGLFTPPSRSELRPGLPTRVTRVYLIHGSYVGSPDPHGAFVFGAPGQYSVVVRYREAEKILAESNALVFDVEEPSRDDAAVYSIVVKRPYLLRRGGREAEELLDAFPGSRCLQYLKVVRIGRWQAALINLTDPQTRKQLRLSRVEREPWKRQQSASFASRLTAADNWGPFEEERLWWAAAFTEWSGDPEQATALRREISTRFPESKEAYELAEEEPR